ncbi:dTDP-4-dehydrorhamnose 3,5-epimerase family protein [Dokdonella sp.]|uniref:dTDP-4-dehydrorhamnose 3,5-epimerase family protein n=1 Tax=Dokdonella sp. TaxID=2291710 RepID=UPI003526D1D2
MSKKLFLQQTPLAGLTVITSTPAVDSRGRLERLFCEDDLASLQPGIHFTQINLSATARQGTVRGMHFQRPPSAEAKLIRCLSGRVFDVAVDLRVGSPTWLQWHAVELDSGASRQIFIPKGFAHGFQALTDNVQLLYMHTASWNSNDEGTLRHDDPSLAIDWPLPAIGISERDQSAALIDEHFVGIEA